MTIPDLSVLDAPALSRLPRCACGAPAFAFRAGTEPERQGDILSIRTGAPAALDPGEPEAARCERCAARQWGDRPVGQSTAG